MSDKNKKEETLILEWDDCQRIDDEVKYRMSNGEPDGYVLTGSAEEDAIRREVYADHDFWSSLWNDTMERLDCLLNETFPEKLGFMVEGSNMGWRHRSGHKWIKHDCDKPGQHLLKEMLPDTDCTWRLYKDIDGLRMWNAHHDAPTGERYVIWPCAEIWMEAYSNAVCRMENALAKKHANNLNKSANPIKQIYNMAVERVGTCADYCRKILEQWKTRPDGYVAPDNAKAIWIQSSRDGIVQVEWLDQGLLGDYRDGDGDFPLVTLAVYQNNVYDSKICENIYKFPLNVPEWQATGNEPGKSMEELLAAVHEVMHHHSPYRWEELIEQELEARGMAR